LYDYSCRAFAAEAWPLHQKLLTGFITIIIIITEYLVPQLQRARLKRHYNFTRVDEELKAIIQ